ncbi:MAG: hypothetical protein P8Y97_21975 [Candidatus Lokiarchaeota archaeon]
MKKRNKIRDQKSHCGLVSPACEVCVPFGFSKDLKESMQGLAQFYDAHILFFPVSSMVGPIWITCPTSLNELNILPSIPELDDRFIPVSPHLDSQDQLNFGWLLLETLSINNSKINKEEIISIVPSEIPNIIRNKIVLISDKLFEVIINSNLEVRTSISIDPDSGAAEGGALFTYEAIPRSTIFHFDVIYNSGKNFKIGGNKIQDQQGRIITSRWVKQKVEKGLKCFETLGIGGIKFGSIQYESRILVC